MDDILTRFFSDLIGRVHGPMHFRMILQPCMACLFAILDGLRDAREGRTAYFWALFTEPKYRMKLLRRSWKSVGKILILALVLDVVYQIWQLKTFYPGEAILTAIILAILPYILLRGPVNRLVQWR